MFNVFVHRISAIVIVEACAVLRQVCRVVHQGSTNWADVCLTEGCRMAASTMAGLRLRSGSRI